MSNSSTSLVQYPLPYKAVDGCLFVEKATKNGTITKKLCNFLPYLKYDINVDDGVEQTRTFRIAGIHESGRLLPEIEVTVKEFGKMDWVDCLTVTNTTAPVITATARIIARLTG